MKMYNLGLKRRGGGGNGEINYLGTDAAGRETVHRDLYNLRG